MNEPDNPVTLPPTRFEVIRQISQALIERRKIRGLSIEKVAQHLKIRIPYLQAMEKGEWDQLPAEVYVRGFVKRYAQFLGLDSEKLLAMYVTATDADVNASAAPTEGGPKEAETNRSPLIWLALVGVFVIGFFRLVKEDRRPVSKPAPKPAVTASVSTATVSSSGMSTPVASRVATPMVKHTLNVYSPFPLWLSVNAEDHAFEGFIPQAATWTWKGGGHFAIRLGHSREVVIQFDGNAVPLAENQKKVDLPNEN